MFKIGTFSRLVQLPVATLRYYDHVGLLKPEKVDDFTGYRYYSADQLPRLHRILTLRGLGFSLEQIRAALNENISPDEMRGMLRLRHAQLNDELLEAQQRLLDVEIRLQQIEHEQQLSGYDVLLKRVEPQLVALVRAVVPNHALVGLLFHELHEALGNQMSDALGAPAVQPGQSMVLWFDEEYRASHVDGAAAFVLQKRIPDAGNMEVVELPACTMASTVHHGSYDTIQQAHEALLKWVEANHYQIVGPDREVYLHNPAPVRRDDPSYITEIQYPVEKAYRTGEKSAKPKIRQPVGIMETDTIVDIPEKRVKFFGTTGKMLLPSPTTIASILHQIGENQIITTEMLSNVLADRFDVQAVCPITTRKSLTALAHDSTNTAPFWRVVKANGDLTAIFPGGAEGQAELLREEGMTIDSDGKKPRVRHFNEKLARLD